MARGDIFLVQLPTSEQREEKGKRPAIAVQTDGASSPMLMVVPVTSSLQAMRFSFTVQIEPSAQNGLTKVSVAMVFQLRALDRKRLLRKIGQLESNFLAEIDAAIWQMLKPPSSES
ncbi:MAG: type II toxin-antitoxin system PemK/MazF family toxin [Cyanobacteria bacterium P01_A01_bin.15]